MNIDNGYKFLVKADRVADYIPVVSSLTNLVDLFQKCVISVFLSESTIEKNHYFTHLNNKSFARCFLLIFPVIGNIMVGIYDMKFQSNKDSIEISPIPAGKSEVDSSKDKSISGLSSPAENDKSESTEGASLTTPKSTDVDSVEIAGESSSRKNQIASLMEKKNVSSFMSNYFFDQIKDKNDLEKTLEYIQNYPTTEGCWNFVENELSKGKRKLPQGWQKQEDVFVFLANIPKNESKFRETVNAVISKSLITKRKLSNSRSVPVFSNSHDEIKCKEISILMNNLITEEATDYLNSEFGFQTQKYGACYLLAKVRNDTERMLIWKKKAEEAINLAKKTSPSPSECQKFGSEKYCPMRGFQKPGVKSGSEAQFWDVEAKYLAMDDAIEAKLKARPDLVLRLLFTKEPITFIKSDNVWGTGLMGEFGEDALGKAYEKVRNKLLQMSDEQLKEWQKTPSSDLKAWEALSRKFVETHPDPK